MLLSVEVAAAAECKINKIPPVLACSNIKIVIKCKYKSTHHKFIKCYSYALGFKWMFHLQFTPPIHDMSTRCLSLTH